MDLDLESLSKGVNLVSSTITTLKKLKDILPLGSKRHDLEQKLEEAEKNLMLAEANIAKGFNYQLCQRHFPPGIMLETAPFQSKCNNCGHTENYEQ